MRLVMQLFGGFALALCLAGPALAAPVAPDIKNAAAAFDPNIPTADPCVVVSLIVEAQDPILPGLPSWASVEVDTLDQCTGTVLDTIGTGGPPPLIGASDFVIAPTHDAADLIVTLPAFESATQSVIPLSVNLHWASTGAVSNSTATVTGTVSGGSTVVTLGNNIAWHRWGSESFPWAAIWPCVFAPAGGGGAGCIDQT